MTVQIDFHLENCGVHPIGRVGEPLDPHAHEIRSVRGDSAGPLPVVAVLRRGYSRLGETIRPALVGAVRKDGGSR